MGGISSIINKYLIVRHIPIFQKLNWFELHIITSKCTLGEYKKGDLICKKGTPSDAFYCLISGRVGAYNIGSQGQKEQIELIHRGMHFGIISLLTGEKHSLNFEAINDTTILKINKDDFSSILESIPRLGVQFTHSLSQRMRSKLVSSKSIFESTIISIYSPVRGTGCSTYAVNLALSLERETNKKVILLNITSKQQVQERFSSSPGEASPQWKKVPVDLQEIVDNPQKTVQSISKGELPIDLLNIAFDANVSSLINEISRFAVSFADDYHFVVIDLPNNMDDVVMMTLMQSDVIHLLTDDREERFPLIRQVIDQLKSNLKDGFREEKIGVIISGTKDKCRLSYEEINKTIDYRISISLPYVSHSELNLAVFSKEMTVICPRSQSAYSKTVTQIARRLGGVSIGLVLGGGAALGLAHIGVLRVLEKENIPIDIIAGSSMGALLGALWTAGKRADEIETAAREFEKKLAAFKLFDPVFPRSGFIGGRLIKQWLKKHLGNRTFYNTQIPLKVVAYDLTRREDIVIDRGSLIDAVHQSIAIPGVMQPILKKDQLIIDGGVLNPLPTNVLTGIGIKKIIAVNVLQSPEQVTRGNDLLKQQLQEELDRSFIKSPVRFIGVRCGGFFQKIFQPNIPDIIIRTLQAAEYVLAEQSATQADVVIHPDSAGINWFELCQVDKLIKNGEKAAHENVAEIKRLIKE